MTTTEIIEKVNEFKKSHPYILDASITPLIYDSFVRGNRCSLKMDTNFDYELDLLNEIKEGLNSDILCISYDKGLHIILYYYT